MAMSPFAIEVWAKYGVAVAIMIIRFITRWRMIGWRNFDGTDFWCALSTCLYTIVSTCDYILSTPNYPTNIGLNPETAMMVPDEKIPLLQRGSKIAHFSWTMYICMIFSFKGVMLSLFRKVGTDIWRQELLVRITSVTVVLSWIASVLTHLLACRPMHKFWQIKPFPGAACTTRPQNYYVAGVLNMITDAMIITIPMPMLWKLQVRLRRKIALGFLFSSGVFIILCSVLRTIYSLSKISDQETAEAWAGREGFVSMIVVSAPGLWPLLRNSRWFDPSYKPPYKKSGASSSGKRGPLSSIRWPSSNNSRRARDALDTEFLEEGYQLSSTPPSRGGDKFEGAGSEEHIIGTGKSVEDEDNVAPITVTTEYSVQHEEVGKTEATNVAMESIRRPDW